MFIFWFVLYVPFLAVYLVTSCLSFLHMQNFPLYLRTVNSQNEPDLPFQYLVHTSIDVIEEKGERVGGPALYLWGQGISCSQIKMVDS